MTDAELLAAAIDAAAGAGITDPRTGERTVRGFARRVLDLDDGTARGVLAGSKRLGRTARKVCRAVVRRPRLAAELARV